MTGHLLQAMALLADGSALPFGEQKKCEVINCQLFEGEENNLILILGLADQTDSTCLIHLAWS